MIEAAARNHQLFVAGVAPLQDSDHLPEGLRSIHLLAPDEPGFWDHVTRQPEFGDGRADPLDRWSARVIGQMAEDLGGVALFPSDQPARPFLAWARRSGRAVASPVQMLVHDRMGLWASFRGAIALPEPAPPAPETAPCTDCHAPCETACPVGAFTPKRYEVETCHNWLDTEFGEDCVTRGCAVRRACPIGQAYGRLEIQSAWHMRQFHP